MHGDEELGIPGHAGKREASKRFQRLLAEAGCSFEAEGDTTRLMLGSGAIIEVKEEPGEGVVVEASIPLPASITELEEGRDSMVKALELLLSLGMEPEYRVDNSLPGYPVLRGRVLFRSMEEAYQAIEEAVLERGCG